MQNRFTNPATGAYYDWHQNHTEEEESGKTREVTRAPNTGLGVATRTQGDDGPLTLRYTGTILRRAQLQAFWLFYKLCRSQTIYFRDFDGEEYEVIITSFTPQRVRKQTVLSPDPSVTHHYWRYSIQMDVIRVISGDLLGVE